MVTSVVGEAEDGVVTGVVTGVVAGLVAGLVTAADDGLDALSLEQEAAASPSTTDAARTTLMERMWRV